MKMDKFTGNFFRKKGMWRRYYTLHSYTMIHQDWLTFGANHCGKRRDIFGIN